MIVQRIASIASAFSSFASSSTGCNDVRECRTLPAIIFNCISTVILCTWVALRLDVPAGIPQPAPWTRLLHRVKWVTIALFAPEAILYKAFVDWTQSSNSLKRKIVNDPACNWTETHAILAKMGGLRVVREDGSAGYLCKEIDRVPSNARMPTAEEIQDRGKGDSLLKAITIIQTLWFAIQAADRVSKGLVVIQLELAALAHVALNIFIYWCWWNKPSNLRFPVEVYVGKGEGRQQGLQENRQAGSSSGPGSQSQRPGSSGAESVEAQRLPPRRLPIRVILGAYIVRRVDGLGNGWGWTATVVVWVGIVFGCATIGAAFGAIHCLAWNSTFPTRLEKTLWRVFALVVTALPPVVLTIKAVARSARLPAAVEWGLGGLFTLIYPAARICLFALALASLRALPIKAYETFSWSFYIPHIG